MIELDISGVLVAVIGAVGVLGVGWMQKRSATQKLAIESANVKAEAERRSAQHARDAMQTLVDQLQEERTAQAEMLREERQLHREDRAHTEAVLDRLYADKGLSRDYVAQLRAWIHAGKPPPPPAPPSGYIE